MADTTEVTQEKAQEKKAPQNGVMLLLSKYRRQIEQAVVGMPAHRMMSLAVTAINRTPDLLRCDPLTVVNSLLYLAQLGLEPRPNSAYLIPFKKNFKDEHGRWQTKYICQPIIDYRGKIDLATRDGRVVDIDAEVVFSRDKFSIGRNEQGRMIIQHEPRYFTKNDNGEMVAITDAERGVPIGAYAIAQLRDGSPKALFMPKIDIERIRSRSKAKDDGPWVTDPGEMWKKTTIHRLTKLLPQSPEAKKAAEAEDKIERGEELDSVIDISMQDALEASQAQRLAAVAAELPPEAGLNDPGTEGPKQENGGGGLKDRIRAATGQQPAPTVPTTPTSVPTTPAPQQQQPTPVPTTPTTAPPAGQQPARFATWDEFNAQPDDYVPASIYIGDVLFLYDKATSNYVKAPEPQPPADKPKLNLHKRS